MNKIVFLVALVSCSLACDRDEELSPLPVVEECESNDDCSDGESCRPVAGVDPSDCNVAWTCQEPAEMCTRDLRVYCSCDGEEEFWASGTEDCAGEVFSHQGFCK